MRTIGVTTDTLARSLTATASGSIAAGAPVVVNVNGTVSAVGGGNLTSENFIGFAPSGVADTANAVIDTQGAVNVRQSGLTPGLSYYVLGTGAISTTPGTPSVFAGTAVTPTKLIVKG